MPQKLTLNGPERGHRWVKRATVGTLVAIPIAVVVVLAILITSSSASLTASPAALATVKLPFGGGSVTQVSALAGRDQKPLAVKLVGNQVYPAGKVRTGETVSIAAIVKRPGWNGWLAGSTKLVRLTVTTPKAQLASSFVTVKAGQDIVLHFDQPVTTFGQAASNAKPVDHALTTPKSSVALKATATAGSMNIAAAPRSWETPATQSISWFPAGSSATAVADPAPGSSLKPSSPITLTFSKPVHSALDGQMPQVSPAGSGSWRTINSHTIQFVPTGYGYGLGAKVQIAVPSDVRLVGGTGDPVASWQVPTGSTVRLQQILAQLGYLPVSFTQTGVPVADSMDAQEAAAVKAPTGQFSWRYANTPGALESQWQPGQYGEITKAAVMAFEYDNNLDTDGIDGPQVWKALIKASIDHQVNTFGYTFVFVHEASSNESETTWHNGKNVVSGVVNTGGPSSPTQTGTFAVFEHVPVTTMSGTNPDGTTYDDPGIPDVSYFNEGDALHGFIRSAYGFPQSDGCVEMPYAEAAQVYPYTPVGTVVEVSTS